MGNESCSYALGFWADKFQTERAILPAAGAIWTKRRTVFLAKRRTVFVKGLAVRSGGIAGVDGDNDALEAIVLQ